MGVVYDRARKVASYLRGRTGFPFIQWDYPERAFTMPDGYTLDFTMCRNARHAVDMAKALKDEKGVSAVVYAFDAIDVEDAVAVMPLRVFTELLELHINEKHLPKLQGKE